MQVEEDCDGGDGDEGEGAQDQGRMEFKHGMFLGPIMAIGEARESDRITT